MIYVMSREMSPRNISSFTFRNTYKHLYKHETRLEAYVQFKFFAVSANQFKKNIGNWQTIKKYHINRFWCQRPKMHLSFVKTYFYLCFFLLFDKASIIHQSQLTDNLSLFVLLPWHQIAFKTSTVLCKQISWNSLQEAFAAASNSLEKSLAFWALAFGF